jgi:hypothetical protein
MTIEQNHMVEVCGIWWESSMRVWKRIAVASSSFSGIAAVKSDG